MENIEGLFKKFVYTGVGLVSMTKDKLQKAIDDMVKEEKISTKEGERIVKDFLENTGEKKKELEESLKKAVDKAIEKLNFAKSKDLEELRKRVEELENKMKEEK